MISATEISPLTPVPLTQRPAAIVCDELVKSFPIRRGWREALRAPFATRWQLVTDHLSCDIAQGELFGLLGPNGAGKSTLMRMLTTAVTPDAGSATIHGADIVADAREVRGMIGAAAANERAVLWRISARDNLRYFAALLGLRGGARTKRIEEVLELVELADTGEKMVGEFSSGMRQRLLIARALLGSPRVLLLDEPTRSLDPISARQFRGFMSRLIREETKCTVVLATHSTEEAMELCDRVGVLDRGRLLAVGRPAELGAELTRNSFRVWLGADAERALDKLVACSVVVAWSPTAGMEDLFREFAVEVADGQQGAAELVRALVGAGVDVARVERVPVSAADIIERVLASSGRRSADV